jgi:subtilisin family serine protease
MHTSARHRTICAHLAISALAIFIPLSVRGGDGTIRRSGDPVPNVYHVLLSRTVPASAHDLALQLTALHGTAPIAVYSTVLKGFSFRGSDAIAKAISLNPNVDSVLEATNVYPTTAPGSQSPAPSWGLDRINQQNLPLDNTWAWGLTGQGVKLYIIDTGISPTQDLAGRIVSNVSFVSTEPNITFDCFGHGSYVASIAGGTTYGVAKDVVFANYRVFDCLGHAPDGDTDIVQAVDTMTSDHLNNHPFELAVANMSLSSGNARRAS